MSINMDDPKMEGYVPLQDFIDHDQDQTSRRIRDMPYGKRREDVSLSAETLDFGNVKQGVQSSAQVIVITNVGWDDSIIYDHKIEGDFSLLSAVPETLKPGETVAVQVVFTPSSTGSRTGMIYFNTGDAAGDEVVLLKGTGTAA